MSHDVYRARDDQLLTFSLAAPADAARVRGTGRPILAVEARIEPLSPARGQRRPGDPAPAFLQLPRPYQTLTRSPIRFTPLRSSNP
jgi:hypothetical protein